jgi:arylformamidase
LKTPDNLQLLPYTRIIDISQPVEEATACFPGDTPFSRKITCTYEDSKVINLTALTMSPHVGTHADAPVHIKGSLANQGDIKAGNLALAPFIGPALVLDFAPTTEAITRVMVEEKLQAMHFAGEESELRLPGKILLKTQSSCNYKTFAQRYSYIAEDLAHYLASMSMELVGLDTPSVDDINSKNLPTHQVLDQAAMVWLENLDLSQVDGGLYFLLALPLKFMELEASPVRAVLLA